jgi:hypothetical protein
MAALAAIPVGILQVIVALGVKSEQIVIPTLLLLIACCFGLALLLRTRYGSAAFSFWILGAFLAMASAIYPGVRPSLPAFLGGSGPTPEPSKEDYYISFRVFLDNQQNGLFTKLDDLVRNTKVTVLFNDMRHSAKTVSEGKTEDDGWAHFNLDRYGPIIVKVCGMHQHRVVAKDASAPGLEEKVDIPVPLAMKKQCEKS